MEVVREPAALAPHHGGAFVPTMGALHEGHLALIRRAAGLGPPVIVSVFVNPTQFGPDEDFDRYPRDLESDVATARDAGAAAVFAPSVETMYPPGEATPAPPLPDVATKPRLEDAHRPGHFAGVCQVVARLFDLVRPRYAVFGEKDYQQLKVIEAMVAAAKNDRAESSAPARWHELEIVAHPTVREEDGLALSSRNAYLAPADRVRALGLFHALSQAKALASAGRDVRRLEETMRAVLVRHRLDVDYAVVRDAGTLMPVEVIEDRPLRGLIAARVGGVRLIDNMDLSPA